MQFENGPYDILFIEPSEAENLIPTISQENKIHNDSLVLIGNIHADARNTSIWENIKNHHKVTVTVDMFYCGAIFFRKEQVKEHFKIRI